VSRRRKVVLGLVLFLVLGEIAARLWGAAVGGSGSLYDYVVQGEKRFKLRPGVSVVVLAR